MQNRNFMPGTVAASSGPDGTRTIFLGRNRLSGLAVLPATVVKSFANGAMALRHAPAHRNAAAPKPVSRPVRPDAAHSANAAGHAGAAGAPIAAIATISTISEPGRFDLT